MVAWLWATSALAQVNTDRLVGQPTAEGPAVTGSAGVGASAGNVRSLSWKADITALYVTLFPEPEGASPPASDSEAPPPFLRDRILLHTSATRASYDGENVDNQGMAHLRLTRMWLRRLGTEVFTQLQYDEFQDLRGRLLLGTGLRFDAVHRARAGIWGGVGAMFERETLALGAENPTGTGTVGSDGRVVSLAARGTSYLTVRWEVVDDQLTLANTAYFQPRLDDPRDFRFLSEGRLAAKINAALSLGTDLVVRHDTRPPLGVQTTDVRLGSSLQLSWSPKSSKQSPP